MVWRVVEEAAIDLQHIAEDGLLNFGEHHARKYTARLLDAFDRLADMPHSAPERQASQQTIRLMPSGSHNIIYIVEDGDIMILRVLHSLQNWFDLL